MQHACGYSLGYSLSISVPCKRNIATDNAAQRCSIADLMVTPLATTMRLLQRRWPYASTQHVDAGDEEQQPLNDAPKNAPYTVIAKLPLTFASPKLPIGRKRKLICSLLDCSDLVASALPATATFKVKTQRWVHYVVINEYHVVDVHIHGLMMVRAPVWAPA